MLSVGFGCRAQHRFKPCTFHQPAQAQLSAASLSPRYPPVTKQILNQDICWKLDANTSSSSHGATAAVAQSRGAILGGRKGGC